MASHGKPAKPRGVTPRLYLVTPQTGDLAGLANGLADALAAGDIAAVLLRLPKADGPGWQSRIDKALKKAAGL